MVMVVGCKKRKVGLVLSSRTKEVSHEIHVRDLAFTKIA
jgi:hypothetical protein